ncbi:MAG: Mlc titration factor MtfA (ptsG expression regulator) [Halioglobus sp.]
MALSIVIAVIAFGGVLWGGFKWHKKTQRAKLLQTPLTPEYIEILVSKVPLYSHLPHEMRLTMQGCINYFLTQKVFVGCNGFVITDEVRLTIAGNACLLVINREMGYFPGFESILVYPETYSAKQVSYDGMVESQVDSLRAGESWHRGPIVLSWSDVVSGSANPEDGHNVILHEFAHKLDEENTLMDGLPILREPAHYKEWSAVLTKEYAEFVSRAEHGKNDVIDEYGAISAAEFFAVATESFFEKSWYMRQKLPELYQQFQTFYGLDPASWESD